jgi:hypothetical protein
VVICIPSSVLPKLKIEPLQDLEDILDSGNELPFPDRLLINGQGWNGNKFIVDQGKLIRGKITDKYFILKVDRLVLNNIYLCPFVYIVLVSINLDIYCLETI